MTTLVQNNQLKSNYWQKIEKENIKPIFQYDEILDTFFFYISLQEKERVIAHYIDEDVAFLYRHSDKEIVGMKIEYFKKSFLPKYANNTWKLSNTGIQLEGIRDFIFKVEAVKTSPLSNQYTIPIPIEPRIHAEPVFA
jgi:hypothetical protein